MSSYEYLSQQLKNHNLSRLEKLGHEWDLGIPRRNIKNLIDVLYINLKFLDIFLSLQTFTSTVSRDVTQKVQDLFPYAEAEFKRIMSPDDVVSLFYNLEEQIWKAKLKIRAKYSFPEAALPLSFNVATPEFVKRFIDTVVMNLSDLPEIRNPYSWDPLVPCSSRQQVEEVGKELKLLRSFVCFVSGRCKDPQSKHTFFNHSLVVVGHAAMISWLSASFSDHQMDILPIQSCICQIYIDILQALKSGWHPNIQTHEHVANYEAGFVETLVHCLEDLSKHQEIVAFKDQRAILQEILNFLRANLINPLREVLEDFGTAIIDIGLLVCLLYANAEEKVLDFSGKIQSVEEMIYLILRKSFHSNFAKIDRLGSIDIILDHLKELLRLYSHSLSSIKSQLWTIQQQLEHFQKKHDGFGSFAMQVFAKAYEVEHIVDCCINKDIPEWCLVHWTGDIIEEITLLMREVEEIHEKEVSNLVLHNTTDVDSAHTTELARTTSMREEMVGFQEVMDTLRQQLIRGSLHLDVISIVGMPGLGKTTLANKLFFYQSVVSHFDVRAKCYVSQVYTRKDLLLTILRGVKKDTVISDKLQENELADKLHKLLMVQRYLIFIDDVWETAVWDDLYPCFCDVKNGSRIILTTRLGDVASHAKLVSDPHFLRLFTLEESWMLLKNKVFNTKSYPAVLEDVGQKIAQKCGGLPLSVVWVACILETMEKEKYCWEQVAANLGSHIQDNRTDVASAHTSEFARTTSIREEMVGFQEVIYTLRWKLIRGSSHLDVISIVGMPGLGKTALANKLFFDQSVVSHFDVRAQCCVSQVYTRKDLLLIILRGVKKDTVISDKLEENELADKLRRLLMVQRYLIFIDDVWETAVWNDLYPCFRGGNNGSRIILTTRYGDVASHAKLVSDPHLLRMFTPEESWMLLKSKVFNTKSCPPVLEDVGYKIAQKCGGLPLSVFLVAGILETMEKEKPCWEQVATNLGSHIQAKAEDIINLSYQDLPFHLKPCFLYFGVFSEDEEIQVSKLTWLWAAEGLVKSHKENHSEDIAEYYLENLIGRNLVMVSKKSSDGKTKECRIHDLLLDFCKKKAEVENFLQCIKGGNDLTNPSSISHQKHSILPRLCLNFQGDNLSEWISIFSDVQSFHLMKSRKIASSSVHHASYTFNSFKFLRVLNLEFTVIDSFPEALTCLRYVAVRIAEDSSLSFSSNLWNLETLIVKGIGGRVSLPDTLWKMVKLRHLHVYNRAIFTIPNAHEEELKELRTLASVWFYCVEDANNVLAKTPNLQKLRCKVSKCEYSFPAFNNLTKLEMLKFFGDPFSVFNEMNFPPSLKNLTLSNGRISNLDQVAFLPRLVVLKLLDISFRFEVCKVTDEQFPNLKFLKLQDPSFSEWNVSDDAFPCLEHLVLIRLQQLEEIPSRFADMPTLKSIEVVSCEESLVESAKDIWKTQVEEMQNCGFKLFIQK